MSTSYGIERIINFQKKIWSNGYKQLGSNDIAGRYYVIDHWNHWVGCLGADDRLCWLADATFRPISIRISRPIYVDWII
jgi:hypothetical protein